MNKKTETSTNQEMLLEALDIFKELGFEGIDASIDISLMEYYFICKEYDTLIHCIYRLNFDEDIPLFDKSDFNKEDIDSYLCDYSEKERQSFIATLGLNSYKDWLTLPWTIKISDLLWYFGFQNVFGLSYNCLTVKLLARYAKNLKDCTKN
jgi:hypothetical protein